MTINLCALFVGCSAGSIWRHMARADSHQDERLLTFLEIPLRRAKLVSGDLDPRAFEAGVSVVLAHAALKPPAKPRRSGGSLEQFEPARH